MTESRMERHVSTKEGLVEIRYTREKEDTMTESRKERHVPMKEGCVEIRYTREK